MVDDDILDLLDVVKPGRVVPAGDNTSTPNAAEPSTAEDLSHDFGADLDAILSGEVPTGAPVAGTPAGASVEAPADVTTVAAPIDNPTKTDHEVNPDEELELPPLSDLDALLEELGMQNNDEPKEAAPTKNSLIADHDDLDEELSTKGAKNTTPPANVPSMDEFEAMLLSGELSSGATKTTASTPEQPAATEAETPATPEADAITQEATAQQEAAPAEVAPKPVAEPAPAPTAEPAAELDDFEALAAQLAENAPAKEPVVQEPSPAPAAELDDFEALAAQLAETAPEKEPVAQEPAPAPQSPAPESKEELVMQGEFDTGQEEGAPVDDIEALLAAQSAKPEPAKATAAPAEDTSGPEIVDDIDALLAANEPTPAAEVPVPAEPDEFEALAAELTEAEPAPKAEPQAAEASADANNDNLDMNELDALLDTVLASAPKQPEGHPAHTATATQVGAGDTAVISSLQAEIAALKAEISDIKENMDKMVAAAAARVIREEIANISKEFK